MSVDRELVDALITPIKDQLSSIDQKLTSMALESKREFKELGKEHRKEIDDLKEANRSQDIQITQLRTELKTRATITSAIVTIAVSVAVKLVFELI